LPETLNEFIGREYDYLRRQEGRDFFLALAPYANALLGKSRVRRVIRRIEHDTRHALNRYVDEQRQFVAEATRIRHELAQRAPEIDNSDMQRPDPASHERARYDLDSFARFNELVDRDIDIGYPTLPSEQDDPGPMGDLFVILRGRLRAAEYGEDASANDPQVREDLGDLARRISNLAQEHSYALRRYRQEARTLPSLAFGRLAHFGSDLNPDPVVIATDEDVEQWLDRTLREWGHPKTIVRKLVNGERLESGERDYLQQIETQLKAEADRLHQELARRLPSGLDYVRQYAVAVASGIGIAVGAGLILRYGFGIG
jgi:hypothetical protein